MRLQKRMEINQRRELEWEIWMDSLRKRLKHRGQKSELARWLGVTRQRLNHWLNQGRTIPGWVVVAITNWSDVMRADLFSLELKLVRR